MARPVVWLPLAAPAPVELAVIKAVRRARLFVFLRLHRHELFDEPFQAELAQEYAASPRRSPGARRPGCAGDDAAGLVRGSDEEVIEATVRDRRWQLVLTAWARKTRRFPRGPWSGSVSG